MTTGCVPCLCCTTAWTCPHQPRTQACSPRTPGQPLKASPSLSFGKKEQMSKLQTCTYVCKSWNHNCASKIDLPGLFWKFQKSTLDFSSDFSPALSEGDYCLFFLLKDKSDSLIFPQINKMEAKVLRA